MKKIQILTLLTLLTLQVQAQINTGRDVLNMMYLRNNKSLYRYMTFDQQSIFYKEEMVLKVEKWSEAIYFPGKLTIKINGFDSGKGMMFVSDSMYVYENNEIKSRTYKIHDLLLLCFDLYFQEPEKSFKIAAELGYDIQSMYTAKYMTRDAYVIGVKDSTQKKNQFWIDKERLTLLRVIKYEKDGTVNETVFENFVQMHNLWVALQVRFIKNNLTWLVEKYNNVKFSSNFDDNVFVPQKFKEAKW